MLLLHRHPMILHTVITLHHQFPPICLNLLIDLPYFLVSSIQSHSTGNTHSMGAGKYASSSLESVLATFLSEWLLVRGKITFLQTWFSRKSSMSVKLLLTFRIMLWKQIFMNYDCVLQGILDILHPKNILKTDAFFLFLLKK